MTKAKTTKKGSLVKQVQEIRNEATVIARAMVINKFFKKLAETNKNLVVFLEGKAKTELNYKSEIFDTKELISAVKNNDPKKEERKATLTARLEDIEKSANEYKEASDKTVESYKAQIAEIEDKMDKVESGEIKVKIDRVNDISDDIISNGGVL